MDSQPTLYNTVLKDVQQPLLNYGFENYLAGMEKIATIVGIYRANVQQFDELYKWTSDFYF
jgi:DNA-binding protein Fis